MTPPRAQDRIGPGRAVGLPRAGKETGLTLMVRSCILTLIPLIHGDHTGIGRIRMANHGDYFRMEQLGPNRSDELALRTLGAEAASFVREQLVRAGHLSSLLAAREMSVVSAWLHADVSDIKAHSFSSGGVGSSPYVWVDELNNAAISSGESLVIADGWSDEPSYPHLKTKQYFVTETAEVYFFSNREHYIDCEYLVRWVGRYPSILCVSSFPRSIEPLQKLPTSAIETMARNTQAIYVGAYDDETFLKVSLTVPPV